MESADPDGLCETGAALVAGCSVVIKPAEETPLATMRIVEILYETGVPHGVVSVVTTSGLPRLIEALVNALKVLGTCVLLGAGKETDLHPNVLPMVMGRTVMGVVNGDCDPPALIPRLMELYRQGLFPIDRLTRFYAQ